MEVQEGLNKLKELVKEKDIAMMCSVHEKSLISRPMATSNIDDEGNIWFFTNEFSAKSGDFKRDRHVCLTYSDPRENLFISISGSAELVYDEEQLHSFNMYLQDEWFPNGLEEPHIALLKISPVSARYWDHQDRRMIDFYKDSLNEQNDKPAEEGYHGKIEW